MDYSKKEVLKNIVEQAIYANFTEEDRKYISIEKHASDLVEDVEDFLVLMIDEIEWKISNIKKLEQQNDDEFAQEK